MIVITIKFKKFINLREGSYILYVHINFQKTNIYSVPPDGHTSVSERKKY